MRQLAAASELCVLNLARPAVKLVPDRDQTDAKRRENELAGNAVTETQGISHCREPHSTKEQRLFPAMTHQPAAESEQTQSDRNRKANFMNERIEQQSRSRGGQRNQQDGRHTMHQAQA